MAREEKKQNRIDYYNQMADNAEARSNSAYERSHDLVKNIPFGQPILVGHYSEKGHRRTLDRSNNLMRESVKESENAEDYRRKAEATENNNAIRTEDDDAVKNLEAKIAKLTEFQQTMKDRNKIFKSKKLTEDDKVTKLVEMGMSESDARKLLEPDFCGRVGYADYQLTNNNATIRNTKKRLEKVKALKSQEYKEYTVNGFRVVENPQENRFQIFFGFKPSKEICTSLHNSGYRWSPTNECWQCYMNSWNINAGKRIQESIKATN